MYLSPVALEWPRLVWAERTLSGSGETAELSWTSAEADPPSPHQMSSASFSQVPTGLFLNDDLYLSSSQGVTRYRGLDAAPDTIQSGAVGVGIRSIAAARDVLAWTAQQAPQLSVYAVGTGQTYRVDGEVWTLVATKDALFAQKVSGSGPTRTFSLSEIRPPN